RRRATDGARAAVEDLAGCPSRVGLHRFVRRVGCAGIRNAGPHGLLRIHAMSAPAADVEARVRSIVSEALDVPLGQVHAHSSLIADLNAESIDFLDIAFRLESAFDIKIPEEDLWRGSIDTTDDASIARGIAELRARMPDFSWHRLPESVTRADLSMLITVQTIVDYLQGRVDA